MQHLDTVHGRHVEVTDDKVGWLGKEQVQRRFAIAGDRDLIQASIAEEFAKDLHEERVVIDDYRSYPL